MLKSLTIKNYILIDALELLPEPGLNIVIGETGAGKSILLGAIGLLTGARADTKTLLDTDEKCVVEGVFEVAGLHLESLLESYNLDATDQLIIRREIAPNGKTRAFINDTPVTLDVLEVIAGKLLDIHSQHDNLLLANPNFQLDLVDLFAQNSQILQQYVDIYQQYTDCSKKLELLLAEAEKAKKTLDYDIHLRNELRDAKIEDVAEVSQLEVEQEELANAQEIQLKLLEATNLLTETESAAVVLLQQAQQALTQAARLSSRMEPHKTALAETLIQVKDLSKTISKEAERMESNPERLLEVNQRLELFYKLFKKHQATSLQELKSIAESLEQRTASVQRTDEAIRTTESQLYTLRNALQNMASKLTQERKNAAPKLTEPIIAVLSDLGMPECTFEVVFETVPFQRTGQDQIQILFSANKGYKPVLLKNAASGGEFSRLMFAIKYLMAQHTQLPTLIFDEIDTGISGEIARKMGVLMKKMAQQHQLLTITHLHQIAARGNTHFYVYKSDSGTKTQTSIRKLTYTDKIEKIAEMIGGANPSETALRSAKELLFSE